MTRDRQLAVEIGRFCEEQGASPAETFHAAVTVVVGLCAHLASSEDDARKKAEGLAEEIVERTVSTFRYGEAAGQTKQ